MNLITHRNHCLPKEAQSCRSSSSAYFSHCETPGQKLQQAFWNTLFPQMSYWSGHRVRCLERWNEKNLLSWWKCLSYNYNLVVLLLRLLIINSIRHLLGINSCFSLHSQRNVKRRMQNDHILVPGCFLSLFSKTLFLHQLLKVYNILKIRNKPEMLAVYIWNIFQKQYSKCSTFPCYNNGLKLVRV